MDFLLEYRNYRGSACCDQISGRHYGMVMDVTDAVLYEASSGEGLIANFEAAVDEYIDFQNSVEVDPAGPEHHHSTITIVVSHFAKAA